MSLADSNPQRFRNRDPIEYFYLLDETGAAYDTICVRGYGVDDFDMEVNSRFKRITRAEYETFIEFEKAKGAL